MDKDLEAMASLLARLIEAGWVSQSFVSNGQLKVVWTDKGKQCMSALRSYTFELSHLTGAQQEHLMFLLTRDFSGDAKTP